MRKLLLLFCIIVALAAQTSPARAEPAAMFTQATEPPANPDRTRLWRSEWPSFSWWEAGTMVAAAAGTAVLHTQKPPTDPRWEGGVLFDEAARSSLRLESAKARQKARAIGDYPYYASGLLPLIVDPLIIAWGAHGDGKAALNMQLMALEAFSYSGLMSYVSTRLSVRERPDSRYCRETSSDCPERDTEAFLSGHTSIAATSAGVVCANHRAMPLWGQPAADATACALATTAAAATAVTRVMSDRHYLTDVLAGFGVGFGFGYAVPTLLHYERRQPGTTISIRPGPCTGGCLSLSGLF